MSDNYLITNREVFISSVLDLKPGHKQHLHNGIK